MFGQMRSRRHYQEKTCPCNGLCNCHQSSSNDPILVPALFFLIVITILVFSIHAFVSHLPQQSARMIEINGQQCQVKSVIDSISSTGSVSRSHDVAECPAKK